MRVKRIIAGILIGAAIGTALDGLNIFFEFLMWPFPVFLPSLILLGGCIGALVKVPEGAGSHRTPQDIERLPACGVDFLTQLTKKMRYRQKVREQVQFELAAHFEDDLKDCLTEAQREQKAEKLIADFGDPTTLAVLMRRAKKRCRPFWRTALARTLQIACMLTVCFVFYVIWFARGEPTISMDYVAMLNRISKPDVRNDDNAWPHYEKAIRLYVAQPPVTEELISYRRNSKHREKAIRLKRLLNDHRRKILEWLGSNRKHWDNLTAEQQAVVLKCLQYNQVPFFKKAHGLDSECRVATFQWMTRYVVRSISDGSEPTASLIGGPLPDSFDPGFPAEELTRWLRDRAVPANLLEAVSVAVLHEADKRYGGLPEDISAPLAEVERQHIASWIGQNEDAWKEFVAATGRSYCYRPYANDPNDERSMLNVLLPHLRGLRYLAFLGSWRSRIDREEGRLQQSMENSLAITRAGRHWQGRGTLTEQLIGLAMNALSCGEILKLAETRRLSPAELADLQDRLSRLYAEGYPTMNMEGERLFVMDVIQCLFTDGGPGGGHLIPQRVLAYSENPPGLVEGESSLLKLIHTAASIVHAGRDATVALANELYDRQITLANMTPYQRQSRDLKMPIETLYSLPRHRYFLIRHLLPSSGRIYELAYRSKMHYESVLTILAIERWRLEKSQYPETLSELVSAGFIKELPMDPFSDKPLIYRRADDNFILYSFGPNFRDDGGEAAIVRGRPVKWGTRDAGDIVIWPMLKR